MNPFQVQLGYAGELKQIPVSTLGVTKPAVYSTSQPEKKSAQIPQGLGVGGSDDPRSYRNDLNDAIFGYFASSPKLRLLGVVFAAVGVATILSYMRG